MSLIIAMGPRDSVRKDTECPVLRNVIRVDTFDTAPVPTENLVDYVSPFGRQTYGQYFYLQSTVPVLRSFFEIVGGYTNTMRYNIYGDRSWLSMADGGPGPEGVRFVIVPLESIELNRIYVNPAIKAVEGIEELMRLPVEHLHPHYVYNHFIPEP